jgi:hypothetical protein
VHVKNLREAYLRSVLLRVFSISLLNLASNIDIFSLLCWCTFSSSNFSGPCSCNSVLADSEKEREKRGSCSHHSHEYPCHAEERSVHVTEMN